MSVEQEKRFREEFTKVGVEEEVQDKLLKKLKDGKLIDSINPEMKDKGKSEKIVEKTKDGKKVKSWKEKITYPDGSITILSVTPGFIDSGTGYVNYRHMLVKESVTGIWTATYRANFTPVNGGFDYISEVYEYLISVNFGEYDKEYFGIDYSSELCLHF